MSLRTIPSKGKLGGKEASISVISLRDMMVSKSFSTRSGSNAESHRLGRSNVADADKLFTSSLIYYLYLWLLSQSLLGF